jgi:hypothetical protein
MFAHPFSVNAPRGRFRHGEVNLIESAGSMSVALTADAGSGRAGVLLTI